MNLGIYITWVGKQYTYSYSPYKGLTLFVREMETISSFHTYYIFLPQWFLFNKIFKFVRFYNIGKSIFIFSEYNLLKIKINWKFLLIEGGWGESGFGKAVERFINYKITYYFITISFCYHKLSGVRVCVSGRLQKLVFNFHTQLKQKPAVWKWASGGEGLPHQQVMSCFTYTVPGLFL